MPGADGLMPASPKACPQFVRNFRPNGGISARARQCGGVRCQVCGRSHKRTACKDNWNLEQR